MHNCAKPLLILSGFCNTLFNEIRIGYDYLKLVTKSYLEGTYGIHRETP